MGVYCCNILRCPSGESRTRQSIDTAAFPCKTIFELFNSVIRCSRPSLATIPSHTPI